MWGLRLLLVCLVLGWPAWGQAPLRMAVMAYRPKAQVAVEWAPLGNHLEQTLGRPVQILFCDHAELDALIARNEVDVVLTNPTHYFVLKQRNVLSRTLATLVVREGPANLSAFGGVIICRAEDLRIQELRDLTDKRIAAVGPTSLGAYQMQLFEMAEQGMPLPTAKQMLFLGVPQDLIVEAVLSGRAEAGFVRSGVLEALVREGKLDLRRLRVINRQELPNFPHVVSTRLQPEWPLAVMPQVDPQLANRLAIALLSLSPDSEAARSAKLGGFVSALDYSGIEHILRKLRLPPFDRAPDFTLEDLWRRYALWICALLGLMGALVALLLRLIHQNRKVHQSEARSAAILDNVNAHICLKDTRGRYLFANRAVLDWMGKRLEELVGLDDEALFEPGSVARIRAVDREVLEAGRTMRAEEALTEVHSKLTRVFLSTKLPLRRHDGEIYALCGISTDITERKEAEATRAYLAAIVESTEDAIVSKSMDGQITSWNRAAERMFGYTAEEAIGQSILLIIPEDRREEEQEILATLCRGGSVDRLETTRVTKAGKELVVSVTISAIRDAEGTPIGASKVIRDISARKRMELDLLEALTFTQQVISSAQEGIVVYDLQGRLVQINTFLEELTGLRSLDLKGREPLEVFPFLAEAGLEVGIRRALAGERVVTPPFAWAMPRTGRSGWATALHGPLRNAQNGIIGAIGLLNDVSELRKAEAEQHKLEADLQQTQKLESIGSLAGGIAHDMNNVLAAIQAMAQALLLTHAQDKVLSRALDTIEKASLRGRDLVKGLTNFARKELRGAEALDLNALVQEEMEILRRTTLQRVELLLELDASRPFVTGERSTLASALMNLCVNAVDAMPQGGTLILRTCGAEAGWVELSVVDSGEGMSPEVMARAMEPFYTTKAVGKGTGLGLAMVYTTAKAHGGTVEIHSEAGKGTRVTLRLPRVAAPAGEPVLERADPEGPQPLEILQVDDDELILASVPVMIEACGHRVRTAQGGREALEYLASGAKVDLVLLDLNMPGMNGEETLRELRKTHPQLPVLLATGFLDTRTEGILKRDPHALCISKPFSMRDLELRIRDITLLAP